MGLVLGLQWDQKQLRGKVYGLCKSQPSNVAKVPSATTRGGRGDIDAWILAQSLKGNQEYVRQFFYGNQEHITYY